VARDRLFQLARGGIEFDERLPALLAPIDAFDIVVAAIRADHEWLPLKEPRTQ
jgi:hypothetical protein